MIKKLKEIAEITSGYTFRGKPEHNSNGTISVIQMKDVSQESGIATELLKIKREEIKERFVLKDKDILFMGKGANNFSVCYHKEKDDTIAVAAFFVIRLKEEGILPKYLVWLLNSPYGQNYFRPNQEGTYIPNVNKTALENFPVKLLSLNAQQAVAQLYELSRQEQQLLSNIKEKKQLYINQLLTSKLN